MLWRYNGLLVLSMLVMGGIALLCGLRLVWVQCSSFLFLSISPNPISVLFSPCSHSHPLLHSNHCSGWVQHFWGHLQKGDGV